MYSLRVCEGYCIKMLEVLKTNPNASLCLMPRYSSGWLYDDGSGNENSFTPVDSDILVADVNFDADTVSSLAGTDEYYQYVTKGFSSGDLTFYANMYGSSSATSAGDVFVEGTYIYTQSMNTMVYPDVVATSATAPSEFSSGTQQMDFYQHQNAAGPEVHMQVKTYYTGADSTLWKVFDGDLGSSTQVQEPDLLFEGETEQARVHSVAWSEN